MFHPDLPMPKDVPISVTYNGQMLLSRATIQKTSRDVWSELEGILLSEADDPRHVPGFAWNGEEEGYVGSIHRAIPYSHMCPGCVDRHRPTSAIFSSALGL